MLLVSAAILVNDNNEILLATRPEGKAMAGLWEFPGGKVHDDELPTEALVRELREELGITTSTCCMTPATFVTYPLSESAAARYEEEMAQMQGCDPQRECSKFYDPDDTLMLLTYICRRWHGEPHPKEGQQLQWTKLQDFRHLQMPPADKPIVQYLWDAL